MLDAREEAVEEHDKAYAFNYKPLWQHSAIVFAGPLANFLLALVILWGINLWPTTVPRVLLAEPLAGSAAALAGLQAEDEITAINEQAVKSWGDLRWALIADTSSEVSVQYLRAGAEKHTRLALPPWLSRLGEKDVFADTSLTPYLPAMPALIEEVMSGGAADLAGVQKADLIIGIDNKPVHSSAEAAKIIRAKAKMEILLHLERHGQSLHLKATPQAQQVGREQQGRLGLRFAVDEKILAPLQHQRAFDFFEAATQALQRVYALSKTSLLMLGKMIIGQAPLNQISGPLTMADYAGKTASLGVLPFLAYLALVSVSIAVLNLLPIPTLDGGHLLLHAVEAVRGTPPSEAVEAWVHKIGMMVLLLFMALAFYNDIVRYFFSRP
jgi:regulator of sigma E protease